MRRGISRAALVVVQLCVVGSAAAQSSVYLVTPPGAYACSGQCVVTVSRIDPDVPAVLSTTALPVSQQFVVPGDGYLTPDGGLLLWLGADGPARHLAIYDVRTRQMSLVPVPPQALRILGHPRTAEVFLTDATGPVALTVNGTRHLTSACVGSGSAPLAISGDGSRLLYSCDSVGSLGQVLVVDTASFTAIGVRQGGFPYPALGRDGRDLYLLSGDRLLRFDTDSGALLAEAPVPTSFLGGPEQPTRVAVDPRTGNVYVIGRRVHVFAGTTLQLQRSSIVPWTFPRATPMDWTFDPDSDRAFASWAESDSSPNPSLPGFAVLDTSTGATLLQVRGAVGQSTGALVVAPRPAAPTSFSASAKDTSVQLSWLPGASNATAFRYVLEAGTAPGLADITVFDVGLRVDLSLVAVPPGTYYVRVRAENFNGMSAPSNEVVVTVP